VTVSIPSVALARNGLIRTGEYERVWWSYITHLRGEVDSIGRFRVLTDLIPSPGAKC